MPEVFETSDASASTGTTYALGLGQRAQGTLGAAGDHDWYRVNLVAGQTYTFALTGTGVNNVRDTVLNIYAPGGTTIVASDNDGLQGANSIVSYTAAASGSYYIDAGALNNAGTGQYGVSFTAGSRGSFDVQMGAGVIDTDQSWSATPGTGVNVTYGFRQTNNGAEATFFQCTSAQMAAVQAVLQTYTEICNLTFTRVNPAGFTNNATMLFANYNENDGAGAYAYYPGSTAANAYEGDVWLNNSVSTSSLPVGSYSYFTLLHEIGHAVGLSHPGKYNAAPGVSITYGANAQFVQDTHQYTIMSYFDESNTTGSYNSYPDTLMLNDIYAVQQIYGANTATRATNTVYGFGSNVGGIYDFATNTNPAMCIWDGGGTDTLNVSGFGQNQVINLNAGGFSDIGGLTDNISIAIGAVIENAVGGSGNDEIDLSGTAVNNVVNGGGGTDTVRVSYGYGAGYTVSGTASNLVMTGAAGTDTLQNVELVIFSNGTQVSTADLAATVPNNNFITISDVVITEGDTGTKTANFTVTRTGGTAAFAVNYTTANGTAISGSDYVGKLGTLNFAAGVNTQTVSITINGDTAVESNETFFVNLSGATNGATITDTQGQGTITDDDNAPVAGAVAIADLTITEGNAGTQVATFSVTRTGGTAAFAVNFATANGSATAGSDYVANSGTLNFAAGVNSHTVSVTINGDTAIEANETFFVNLSGATNGATFADNQGQGTIIDNDRPGDDFADSFTDTTAPFGAVAVGGTVSGNLENAGDHDWFAVTLTAGVSVNIALQGADTAAGTLSDPFVYLYNGSGQLLAQNDDAGTGTNSQLTFTPTATGTYYIDAASYADSAAGTYKVSVAAAPASAGSITISDLTVAEGDAGTQVATFTVVRTGGTAAFAVHYATVNGSAAAGSDYVATSGNLNFAAGVNSQTISVTVNGDLAVESNETFFVSLSGATNGATIADIQGQATIIDNDLNGDDFADDFGDGTAPIGELIVNNFYGGELEDFGDYDLFRISLTAGGFYSIDLQGVDSNSGSLLDPYLYLYDSAGQYIFEDDDSGIGTDSSIFFAPDTSGFYYVFAGAFDDDYTGDYTISVTGTPPEDDFADSFGDFSKPLGHVTANAASGNIEEEGDRDWFDIQLTAGTTYTIKLQGQQDGIATLEDPYLRLYNSVGALIAENDDIVSGVQRDSQLSFTPTSTGTYYLAAGAFDDDYIGTYRLSASGVVSKAARNDFNGDGKSDVLFSKLGAVYASNYEWQLNDRALLSEGAIDLYDKSFTVQVVGDFDGDRRADILFQNPTTGGVWEWRLDGRTVLSQGAVDVGDPSFHLLGTGDFNGDNRQDVLFRNNAGFLYEWEMNGLHNTPRPVGPLDPTWHVQGTGDFNGDGKDDILLRKTGGAVNENGAFFLWQMNGNIVAAQGGIERPPTAWKTLGIGDFDGDGKDDFAVRNVSATPDNGAVWVYLMNGTAIKAQGAAGIADAATWHLQQIGDLNGDGRDDILFRNDAGYFYSWNMNGTTIASEGLLQGAAQHADPTYTVVKPYWDLV